MKVLWWIWNCINYGQQSKAKWVGLESVYVMTTAVVSTASLVCAPHQPFHREVIISLYSQNYLVSDSQVLFLYY